MFAIFRRHVSLARDNSVRKTTYTFYWSGKDKGVRRDAGVAIAIASNIAKDLIFLPQAISDRPIKLRLPLSNSRYLTIVCCYAPTMTHMTHTDESKEHYYEALRESVKKITRSDKLMILRDFNARVGNDMTTWPRILGNRGKGACN